jgi:hypothetical protein
MNPPLIKNMHAFPINESFSCGVMALYNFSTETGFFFALNEVLLSWTRDSNRALVKGV